MANDIRHGYKVLTSKYRSPIQSGAPLWDGKELPIVLPAVSLDTSQTECSSGWNYCGDIATALSIAGFWPDGYPSVVFRVEAAADAIERGDKRRSSSLTLLEQVSQSEIESAIRSFSDKRFGVHAAAMADEQIAWHRALARAAQQSSEAVERGLRLALTTRGLTWDLKQFENEAVAWAARDARDARDAWVARAAWAARDARAARDAWVAWAAWAARAARDAWAAWAALTVHYSAVNKWTNHAPNLLTDGIRDAYSAGLAIALPVSANTLGWAMVPAPILGLDKI